MARAASELPARSPGRGLTSDRASLEPRLARTAAPRRRIDRLTHSVTTTQGEFTIDNYDLHENAVGDVQKRCGINIDVKYVSPTSLRSNHIGFVQVMKVTKDGVPFLFANEKPRATREFSGDEGWTVDRLQDKTQGFYGMKDDLTASGTNYWAGSRTSDTVATVFAEAIRADKIHNRWGLPGHFIGRSGADLLSIDHGVEEALAPLLDDQRPLTIDGSEAATLADTAGYRVADLAGYLLATKRGDDVDATVRDAGIERLRS